MELADQIRELLTANLCESDSTRNRALAKLDSGGIIQAEDPREHFCVMFLAMDLDSGQVLVAHHRHAGMWLFTGGHIEPGESLAQALNREIQEELGLPPQYSEDAVPFLFNVIDGMRYEDRACTTHYLLWYLLQTTPSDVTIKTEEITESRWVDLDALQGLMRDPTGIAALGRVIGLLQP